MLNEVLQSIRGIAVYPIIGLFIFVAAFAYVIVHTWRMTRSEVDYASRLPLDPDQSETIADGARCQDNRQGERHE